MSKIDTTKSTTESAPLKVLAISPTLALPANIILPSIDEDDFDSTDTGEVFGGNYPFLEIEAGETTNYLRFARFTSITLANEKGENELIPVALFQNLEGAYISGPIGAIFRKQLKEMDITEGDIVRIRREDDVRKKAGRGAGQIMQVYSLKRYYSVRKAQAEAAKAEGIA